MRIIDSLDKEKLRILLPATKDESHGKTISDEEVDINGQIVRIKVVKFTLEDFQKVFGVSKEQLIESMEKAKKLSEEDDGSTMYEVTDFSTPKC